MLRAIRVTTSVHFAAALDGFATAGALVLAVCAGLAGFPAAVVMIRVAVLAPRSVAFAGWALVDVSAIAFTERRNVSVAAQ